jgi:hypothetical protein
MPLPAAMDHVRDMSCEPGQSAVAQMTGSGPEVLYGSAASLLQRYSGHGLC